MAKKDKKKSSEQESNASTPADAVRGAVEQAFAATFGGAASTRGLAQDLVEEIGTATQRVRQALEDLRVIDDLRGLRAELEALNRRVESLEAAQNAKPARASAGTKPAGMKPAGTKPAGPRGRSAASARKDATAGKPAARRTAPRSAASARKSPAVKPPAESSTGRS